MAQQYTQEDIELRKTISKRLWSILEDQNMTQKELSDASGVTLNTLATILYDKNTCRVTNLVKISKALMVSMDYICGISDEM